MTAGGASDNIVLSDGNVDPGKGILHIASPFMIGLVGSVLGMWLIAPDMMRHSQLVVVALLMPAMIVSIGIYAMSVINPGEIVALVADPRERTLEIIRANSFSSRHQHVAFEDVIGLALTERYDRDGYPTRAPVLSLRTGERMALAFNVDEARLAAMRARIGLRG